MTNATSQPPDDAEPTLSAELGSAAKDFGAEVLSSVGETLLGYLAWGMLFVGMLLAVLAPAVGLVVGAVALVIAFFTGVSKIFSGAVIVLAVIMWVSSGSALGMLPDLFALL